MTQLSPQYTATLDAVTTKSVADIVVGRLETLVARGNIGVEVREALETARYLAQRLEARELLDGREIAGLPGRHPFPKPSVENQWYIKLGDIDAVVRQNVPPLAHFWYAMPTEPDDPPGTRYYFDRDKFINALALNIRRALQDE